MHIVLTDILACPVCGPPFGLIVRSDELRERRVVEGELGCPNCERHYRIRDGIALLDPERPGGGDTVAGRSGGDTEAAVRMAALMGLVDAGGFALVAGPAAALAAEVAAAAPEVEIIADASHASPGAVSRISLGDRLPFHDAKLRGIWLSGESADRWLAEAGRALHATGRLLLEPAPPNHADRLTGCGLRIAAEQDGTVLASRV